MTFKPSLPYLDRRYIRRSSDDVGTALTTTVDDLNLGIGWFNVKSSKYGAKGDATTDDTTAIQAAIDAAIAANSDSSSTRNHFNVVYFPPGIYLTKKLTLSNVVMLMGASGPLSSHLCYNGAGGAGESIVKITKGGNFPGGGIKYLLMEGFMDNIGSGNIPEHIIDFDVTGLDHGMELHDLVIRACYGDGINFKSSGTDNVINFHTHSLRFDAIGGHCMAIGGGADLESRPISLSRCTWHAQTTGYWSTLQAALTAQSLWDGTNFGKGFLKIVDPNGLNIHLSDCRCENSPDLIPASGNVRSLIYTYLDAISPGNAACNILLDNFTGFAEQDEAFVIIHDTANAVSSLTVHNQTYTIDVPLMLDGNGDVLPPQRPNVYYNRSSARTNGIALQDNQLEFRSTLPSGSSGLWYKRGDIIFNNVASAYSKVAERVVADDDLFYHSQNTTEQVGSNVTTVATDNTVTFGAANDARLYFPNCAITLEAAGPASADLATYVTSIDPTNGTMEVNDAPSVNSSTIVVHYTRPTTEQIIPRPRALARLYYNAGDPEGVITADPGSLCFTDVDDIRGGTVFEKVTGSGNTGWYASNRAGDFFVKRENQPQLDIQATTTGGGGNQRKRLRFLDEVNNGMCFQVDEDDTLQLYTVISGTLTDAILKVYRPSGRVTLDGAETLNGALGITNYNTSTLGASPFTNTDGRFNGHRYITYCPDGGRNGEPCLAVCTSDDGTGTGAGLTWRRIPILLEDVGDAHPGSNSLTFQVNDIATAQSYWIVTPWAGTISKIYTVVDGTTDTGATTISFELGGTAITNGNVTIANGAVAGEVDSSTPTAANTVTAGQAIEVITDGGTGASVNATVTLVINR